MNIKIKRALISVFDKTGVEALAQTLVTHGCEIISTGGTLKKLQRVGIPVTEISTVTQNPEAFGGRMKTISFNIESAILFDRERDAQEAHDLSIKPIDMVVCNFYPFRDVMEEEPTHEQLIENIDIGGPTMVRAAAKNHKYVTVITDTSDYLSIIQELNSSEGTIQASTRELFMRKAFHYTADYDSMIATAMDLDAGQHSIRLSFSGGKALRYGENPHQEAMFYRERSNDKSLYDFEFLNGKELSYNNLLDVNTAIDGVGEFENPACCVIKHGIPCGLAESKKPLKVLEHAWASDPISAFGSVIAINCEVDVPMMSFLNLHSKDKSKRKFLEVIIAPSFTPGALDMLKSNKNLRVLKHDFSHKTNNPEMTLFKGSMLVQEKNNELYSALECVTNNVPEHINEELMSFGIKIIKHIRSNAIAIVRQLLDGTYQLLGMGSGQPNRVTALKLAIEKSKNNLFREFHGTESELNVYIKGIFGSSILISEAFFPFEDSIELCAQENIKTIVQPGGSIRDNSVIEACNRKGLAMFLTGIRHFKH